MNYYICRLCKIRKKETDFYFHTQTKKLGEQYTYRNTMCKKCFGIYTYSYRKKKVKELKIKAVNYLGGKCSRCGYDKCLKALDFHHKEGKRKKTISQMIYKTHPYRWEVIKKELNKCELLCANCHRELHYK